MGSNFSYLAHKLILGLPEEKEGGNGRLFAQFSLLWTFSRRHMCVPSRVYKHVCTKGEKGREGREAPNEKEAAKSGANYPVDAPIPK